MYICYVISSTPDLLLVKSTCNIGNYVYNMLLKFNYRSVKKHIIAEMTSWILAKGMIYHTGVHPCDSHMKLCTNNPIRSQCHSYHK